MSEEGKIDLGNEPAVDSEEHSTDEAFLDQNVSDVPESTDEEMERLRRTAAEADKRVLMAQAEAENFRKRMRRDLEEQLTYAALPLITDLLEVRDNLVRALEAADSSTETSGLKEGVAMVAKQLDDTL